MSGQRLQPFPLLHQWITDNISTTVKGIKMLTQARLKELFSYDPETGVFLRIKPRKDKGHAVGSVTHYGYLSVMIDYKAYKVHRLAWLWEHGDFPISCIDHIDGDRLNNRIANLRQATHKQNNQNRRYAIDRSSTGTLGVYKGYNGGFKTQISVDGKQIHLGRFKTLEAASEAYKTAKRQYHEFCMI